MKSDELSVLKTKKKHKKSPKKKNVLIGEDGQNAVKPTTVAKTSGHNVYGAEDDTWLDRVRETDPELWNHIRNWG